MHHRLLCLCCRCQLRRLTVVFAEPPHPEGSVYSMHAYVAYSKIGLWMNQTEAAVEPVAGPMLSLYWRHVCRLSPNSTCCVTSRVAWRVVLDARVVTRVALVVRVALCCQTRVAQNFTTFSCPKIHGLNSVSCRDVPSGLWALAYRIRGHRVFRVTLWPLFLSCFQCYEHDFPVIGNHVTLSHDFRCS